MSRIRSKNTEPERRVRSILHRLGYRFRLHCNALPGRPDIVLPKYRVVILVHGCFWHRHRRCRLAYTPKSRIDFWTAKFAANRKRDRTVTSQLRLLGWRVVTVWECQIEDLNRLEETLSRVLSR
jgi:DNA mismatch endonuclease (patch repair protein)